MIFKAGSLYWLLAQLCAKCQILYLSPVLCLPYFFSLVSQNVTIPYCSPLLFSAHYLAELSLWGLVPHFGDYPGTTFSTHFLALISVCPHGTSSNHMLEPCFLSSPDVSLSLNSPSNGFIQLYPLILLLLAVIFIFR